MANKEEIKKILFVLNPRAGKVHKDKLRQALEDLGQKHQLDMDFFETKALETLEEDLSKKVKKVDLVVSLGGDGSNFYLANALVNLNQHRLGLIPLGTGNDLAKSLGLTRDLEGHILAYKRGDHKDLYPVRLNQYIFLNTASFGLDIDVIDHYNHYQGGEISLFAYPRAILKALFFDGKNHLWTPEAPRNLVEIFANGEYFGGGLPIALGQDPANSTFTYLRGRARSLRETLKLFYQLLTKKHRFSPLVKEERRKSYRLDQGPRRINLDGELVSLTSPLLVEKSKTPLKIFGDFKEL